jgi:Bacterial Ig-like domain
LPWIAVCFASYTAGFFGKQIGRQQTDTAAGINKWVMGSNMNKLHSVWIARGRAGRWLSSFALCVGGLAFACGNGGDQGGHGHDHDPGHGHGGGGGGSAPTFAVGGTVAGLSGSGLVLRNNGGDDLAILKNGVFSFATRLATGSGYSVAVAAQPTMPKQSCMVDGGIGSVRDRDITTVKVSCQSVPLTLTSSVPANGARDVLPTAPIVLNFSAALDSSTVTASNVTLRGPNGAVSLAASAAGNVLKVAPASALAVHSAYTITVSAAVRGAAGEQLASAVTVSFTTADRPWTTLIGRSSSIAAQSEAYKCTRMAVPADLYLTGFRTVASPNLRLAFVGVSSDDTQALGDFDCNFSSISNTQLIYAAAVGTDDFLFPTGVGIHVLAGQKLVLVMHEINDSDAPATAEEAVQVLMGTPSDVGSAAEMILMGTTTINVPNDGQEHTADGFALLIHDRQFIALLPLMRSRGVHQQVTLTDSGGTSQTLIDDNFDPSHQIFHPLNDVSGSAQTKVSTVCTYVNNGTTAVTFGESASNELCFSAVYATPSNDTLVTAGLDGRPF